MATLVTDLSEDQLKEIERRKRYFKFGNTAYLRDATGAVHTGESLMLAMLMHTKGGNRKSQDMVDIQRIMRDHNLDAPDND